MDKPCCCGVEAMEMTEMWSGHSPGGVVVVVVVECVWCFMMLGIESTASHMLGKI